MKPEDATYPPLDVAKPVAPGIWIVDSGPLSVMGIPVPVRMTVRPGGRLPTPQRLSGRPSQRGCSGSARDDPKRLGRS